MPETSRSASPPAADLGENLAADMAMAWRRGERPSTEEYLDRYPELLHLPEDVLRLIYEEVCLRQERGEAAEPQELLRRFPQWANELAVMLDCHRLVQTHLAAPPVPGIGESLGGFRLIAELGRGSQGRVFLATQPTLADRPVVLKVTPRQDREFLSLARLQHTHIIPLHGVHDFPARNLRALCQPYLGGATLARLLDLLRPIPVGRRTGKSLVDALDRAGAASSLPIPSRGGPREALARASYTAAVCWIGACLTDGLQYAHERGLVHLDLKPSNVLLAADGQPLLLDFHLALQSLAPGQAPPEEFGGTRDYMSPEQQRACAAALQGAPVPEAVDGRSDLYSLGRLLYVALAGDEGAADCPLPLLHQRNPQVSMGLSDLIHKAMAPNLDQRYASAGALGDDLRRHLAHLPLQGVPNRSLRERWQKWRRRRPTAPLWLGLLLAMSAAAALLAATLVGHYHDIQADLVEGQGELQRGAYREAVHTLARGKARAESLPGGRRLAETLDHHLQHARRAQAAVDLHAVAECLRFLAGADIHSIHELEVLEGHCHTAWAARGLVADRGAATLDGDVEEQLRADLLDLALLWADLKRQLGPRSGSGADRGAVRSILAEAEALLGPSVALDRERCLLAGPVAPAAPPLSSWEHVVLGRSLLRSGELERAAEQLDQATDLRPHDFWAHFYRGVCAYRQQQYTEAVHSFGVAIALAPRSPECYYNRALAYAAWGKKAQALADYDRALALAPQLGAAALNRGVLHYQEGRWSQAKADLEQALTHDAEPAAAHYNLALVWIALGEPVAARRHVEQALHYNPRHTGALALRKQL
jgi:serine/threonine protein kinase/tetratricopeptide (TPR) repeat protein